MARTALDVWQRLFIEAPGVVKACEVISCAGVVVIGVAGPGFGAGSLPPKAADPGWWSTLLLVVLVAAAIWLFWGLFLLVTSVVGAVVQSARFVDSKVGPRVRDAKVDLILVADASAAYIDIHNLGATGMFRAEVMGINGVLAPATQFDWPWFLSFGGFDSVDVVIEADGHRMVAFLQQGQGKPLTFPGPSHWTRPYARGEGVHAISGRSGEQFEVTVRVSRRSPFKASVERSIRISVDQPAEWVAA